MKVLGRLAQGVAVLAFLLILLTPLLARQGKLTGQPAPDFELEDLDGEMLRLGSMKGKVVVLDFWAVWCGPCQDSVPFFQLLEDKYAADGLKVIGLHVDDRVPPVEKVKQYLDEKNVEYSNALSTTDVDNAFKIYAMPTTYMIDRDGVLAEIHVGFNPSTTPDKLEEDVRKLLGLEPSE